MGFVNSAVGAVLRSPAHRLLSGSTVLLAYEGRRSGRRVVLPTQYARSDGDLVVLVGRPETKRWWRNFKAPHDVDVLVAGEWRAMTGEAFSGADLSHVADPLLDAYLARFPQAVKALGPGTDEERRASAVLVRCRPR